MKKARPFVHLHLHTAYSMLDGACHIQPLFDRVAEEHMPAVAMTDHGVMHGAIEFYKTANAKGIKPLIGCEVYVTNGDISRRGEDGGRAPLNHLVLLAADNTGYSNLMRLNSISHLEGFYYKPRLNKAILAQHSKGLIALSACLKGEVASRLSEGLPAEALKAAGEYADIFGRDNFFLELQDHGIPEQKPVNAGMLELAKKTGLRLVATNDVHYVQKSHAEAHEVLLCIQTQTVMSDPKRMRYSSQEFFFKTREEMERLFGDHPDALDITVEIASRCNVEIDISGKMHFPTFKVPGGMPQKQYLLQVAYEGMRRHYGIADPAHPADARERELLQRLHDEIAIIEKTGFINYFLVVRDFVDFARTHGIPVGPGRGSGGGSMVAYCIGITGLDPIRYKLIFERFLNPERVSPPDFDIDFCQSRRGEVIEYVKNKYGRENCAQIITFGSLGPKTVIRDVGRVLEVPFAKCDQLSKMIPEDPKIKLKTALQESAEFRAAYETDPDCKRIMGYALVLEGLYRNQGTHAAGVVIGEKPLIEIVPLCRDKEGETITQYTMEPLGEIGLLKMDFLGLKTLTVIQEAVEFIRTGHGVEVDLEKLPLDDRATNELLSRGDTVGIFQLESGGMRDLIRRIGITSIEDIIAVIALYRPGPMNMLPEYVERKTGRVKFEYDHPLLEEVLKDTYGVMVYQEQVQMAAKVLAGYTLGKADLLRRAMSKKKAEAMQKERANFIEGCMKTNKIRAELAGGIFDNIEKFAGYGFNKAHSAGYGILCYQTAWLKANYPAEFMAALISSEMGNADKLPHLIDESIAMDLEVKPPDVNASEVRFLPEGRAIRFGLAGIKNVGEGATVAIVAERRKNGPFKNLVDFCSRVDSAACNKKALESLIRCGACDSLGPDRARLFGGIDFAMSRAARALSDKRSGQSSLFDMLDQGSPQAGNGDELPPAPPWPQNEMLASEKELLGFYMSGHPLTQYAPLLAHFSLASTSKIGALPDRTPTRLGGIISKITKKTTKKSGEMMAVLSLEDLEGTVEALVFPEAFQRISALLLQDAAVMACGEVSRRDDQSKFVVQEIHPLDDAPRLFAKNVYILVPTTAATPEHLQDISALCRKFPGNTPVTICLQFPNGEKVFIQTDNAHRITPDRKFLAAVKHEFGEISVHVTALPAQPRPARKFSHGR